MSLCWGSRWEGAGGWRGSSGGGQQRGDTVAPCSEHGPWAWRGPCVPRGELGVQSAALGLIQGVLASTGASAGVAALAFGLCH